MRNRFNVSSVEYISVGYYRVNFATPFSDNNYATVVGHSLQPNALGTHGVMYTFLPTTTEVLLYNCADSSGAQITDKDEISIVIYKT